MRKVHIKNLHTGCGTDSWQKHRNTCFSRKWGGSFGCITFYKVEIEKKSFTSSFKSWNCTTAGSERILGCQWDSLRLFYVDKLLVWDMDMKSVPHSHCDWLMPVFTVPKFRKINLNLKRRIASSQREIHILCENTHANSVVPECKGLYSFPLLWASEIFLWKLFYLFFVLKGSLGDSFLDKT